MRGFSSTHFRHGLMATSAIVCVATGGTAQAQTRAFNVPAQEASSGVAALARQADAQILISARDARGRRTNAVTGDLTIDAALAALLDGTGLEARATGSGSWAVVRMGARGESIADGGGRNRASSYGGDVGSEGGEGIAEILVVGSKSQNVDIRRTEDGPQPYLVFDSEAIQRSGATTLEDFLKSRLPMNSQRVSATQSQGGLSTGGNIGRVSLRGLSSDQTLILVDGRRIPGVGLDTSAGMAQPAIAGISPNSIDRIEVLPSTAGGIYGGNAVGGVINVVLKRDYKGLDITSSYGITGQGDAQYLNFGASGGASWGETSISLSANYFKQSGLLLTDRDLTQRGRLLLWQNAPNAFSQPITSSTANICGASGASTFCSSSIVGLTLDSQFGSRQVGSRYVHIPAGYAGPATQNISSLVDSAGINFAPPAQSSLTAGQSGVSVSANIRQEVSNWLALTGDVSWNTLRTTSIYQNTAVVNVPGSNAANPFQENVAVRIPLADSVGRSISSLDNLTLRAAAIMKVHKDWSISVEDSWTRTNSNNQIDNQITFFVASAPYLRTIAFTDGAPDLAQLDQANFIKSGPFETTLNTVTLRFAGKLFSSGRMRTALSGYIENRNEKVDDVVTAFTNPYFSSISFFPQKSRVVKSAYVEANTSILSNSAGRELVSFLSAIRYDQYRTTTAAASGVPIPSLTGPFPSPAQTENVFHSTDYTLGIKFSPLKWLSFRGSYGTGFLPPNLGQIEPVIGVSNFSFYSDPQRGGMPLSNALPSVGGGRADVNPERSRSYSLGILLEPKSLCDCRLSVDYVDITKHGEIYSPTVPEILAREQDFSDRVTRGARLPSDDPSWLGPITKIDTSVLNIALTRVRAIDVKLDASFAAPWGGKLDIFAVGSRQLELSRKTFDTDLLVEQVDFLNGPLRFRGFGGISWTKDRLRLDYELEYIDSHKVCNFADSATTCATTKLRQGSERIPVQVFQNLRISRDLDEVKRGLRASFSIQNLFDRAPALRASTSEIGYDQYGDPRGRRFLLTLTQSVGK